jgi:hypothetical protein
VRVGKRRSRAAAVTAKAMEGVKILDCSPDEPPGVWGLGTFRRWRRELGRPSPARWPACVAVAGASRLITGGEPGSGLCAGRVSEAAVVPLEPTGQQNPR